MCGVCGILNNNWLCAKCEILLKKNSKNEIINIHNNNNNEIEFKYFDELIYIFKYEDVIRKLIIDYKFRDNSYKYKTFVNFLIKNEKIFEKIKSYDTIIAVPISKKRKRERGYNQSLLIAREIAVRTKVPLLMNCLYKTRNIIEQSKLNKEQRDENIKGAYELRNMQIISNKKVLLIDDVYTTGNTVNECSRMLRQGNVDKIGILVLAKD